MPEKALMQYEYDPKRLIDRQCFQAILENDLPRLRACLAMGGDIHAHCGPYEEADTLMSFAARAGHLDIFKFLAEDCGLGIDYPGEWEGHQNLTEAAIGGHLDMVKYLVENGADIEMERLESYTPLARAAQYGNIDIVKYLVAQGANIHVKNVYDRNLLFCTDKSNLEMIRYVVETLGFDPNDLTEDGETLLMNAVSYGESYEVVRYILENYHPDINAMNYAGQTALDFSLDQSDKIFLPNRWTPERALNKQRITELLKQHGAVPGKERKSPEHAE